MTQNQRDAITSPAEGLFIYNTDSKCLQFYTETSWSDCLGKGSVQTNKLDCNSVNTNGVFSTGLPFTNLNTLTIDVLVNSYDTYNITTNTVNGYSFSGSGIFSSLGVNTVTLTGSGTPIAAQTDTFTIDFIGTNLTCNVDVTVMNGFAANCLEYYNAGSRTDGIYTIDPDGTGGNPSYDCYCDMTNDGGGWTLVFNHNYTGGIWANDAEANEHHVGSPGLTTNKYSILSKLDDIKSTASYEFRLHYPSLGQTNHWSQTFDPRSGRSGTNPVSGYGPVNIDMTDNSWGGLEFTGTSAYLGGSIGRYHPYYAIGVKVNWIGGIRTDNSVTDRVQLFVR
ncbi:fibrinogen-like YCDxxxxGGGW domain-containing protein [Flavivirga amylovorans]|uniref:Fibrinogen-like YCDxxxxGGGW domain-containing protein n=1 Tax=Flavivirga amylovorans TaxID=870486 RepID=A0ABT8WXM7_9FLAO|nr:fibrinogen-like YCDxxxxGGGW domain-containing protein [Flavivirga amylovorans]MDO5986447.1 fibrinogen-like YCDxxxxGGGW domain-containing protein [Flavivirga amylovorans]